jgi:hypothetical protein
VPRPCPDSTSPDADGALWNQESPFDTETLPATAIRVSYTGSAELFVAEPLEQFGDLGVAPGGDLQQRHMLIDE